MLKSRPIFYKEPDIFNKCLIIIDEMHVVRDLRYVAITLLHSAIRLINQPSELH